ncbi:MAG: CsiV family protein, partial [Pseudomonadales bacterium]
GGKRVIRNLIATIVLLLAISPSLVTAKDNVEDWLSKNWYATEVIVFQRSPVTEYSSTEKLVMVNERRFPFALRAFIPTPDAIGSFYALDPLTRATLDFPIVDINLEEFSFLEPTEAAKLADGPVENDALVPRDGAPPIIEPPFGRPPPVIEPFLEPNPLLDFLAMLSIFERSLDAQSYRWLPEDELLMQTEARRIEARDALHILLHGRWIQPVPERTLPEPLLVQTGARVGNTQQLEGTMAVTLGRYLHFQATLWYREPALGQQPVDIPLGGGFLGGSPFSRIDRPITLPESNQGYMLLSQSRRLRSNEIHYLDHPKFGIVVRIDPVAVPQELIVLLEALEEVDE